MTRRSKIDLLHIISTQVSFSIHTRYFQMDLQIIRPLTHFVGSLEYTTCSRNGLVTGHLYGLDRHVQSECPDLCQRVGGHRIAVKTLRFYSQATHGIRQYFVIWCTTSTVGIGVGNNYNVWSKNRNDVRNPKTVPLSLYFYFYSTCLSS